MQGPTSSVGIYIETGSVYETAETTGASNLLEYMAFKASPHRTSFRVMREVGPFMSCAHALVSMVTQQSSCNN